MENVIVAGGAKGDDTPVVPDDIEILDWMENSQWKRVAIVLPVRLYPCVSCDSLSLMTTSL